MIFPIGDDQVRGGFTPLFSYGIIILNVAVFIFQARMPEAQLASFVYEYGSIPVEIAHGEDLHTLVTSMFLHGGWLHLIGNMLFLWVFADNIEAAVGNVRFVLFYLLGGLAAVGAHIFFHPFSEMPMVGASGAISAVLGAYLVMFPHSRIKVLLLILVFRVPALLFLGFWIWQQWLNGRADLDVPTEATSGVAWWAHIGGFAFGLLAGIFFRARGHMSGVELHDN